MILERLPDSRFSRVLPCWRERVVVLLAGGPSLTEEQFRVVAAARAGDRVRAIAINDSYLRAPWADVHYAADAKWHGWHTAGIPKPDLGLSAAQVRDAWAAFPGQKCTIQSSAERVPDGVHVMRNRDFPLHGSGISLQPEFLVTGRHSGFQALNMAILAGARAVLLCGYDARLGEDGRPHWHGDHPDPQPTRNSYENFRRAFTEAERAIAATGVRVINCSLTSRIDTFPKMELAAALEAVGA